MAGPTTLGQRVKWRRRGIGITQAELALRTRLCQSWISQIENDRTAGRLPARTLRDLADGLDVTLTDLIAGDPRYEPLESAGFPTVRPPLGDLPMPIARLTNRDASSTGVEARPHRSERQATILGPPNGTRTDAAGWRHYLETGRRLSARADFGQASRLYALAGRQAAAAGLPVMTALCKAHEAVCWIDLGRLDRVRDLAEDALHDLGLCDLPADRVPAVAALQSRIGKDEAALRAYLLLSRVTAARWHNLGYFGKAILASATALSASRALNGGGGPDTQVADAWLFLAKARLEQGSFAQSGGLEWRLLRGDGRAAALDALEFFRREAASRPVDDLIGHAHNSRNVARAARLLGMEDEARGAARRAIERYEAAAQQGAEGAVLTLYFDQGRWASADGRRTAAAEAFLQQAADLAWRFGWVTHLSMILGTLAELYGSVPGMRQPAATCALAAFLAWPNEVETPDSWRTVQLLRRLDLTATDLHRFAESDSPLRDQLELLPGVDIQRHLASALRRLAATR